MNNESRMSNFLFRSTFNVQCSIFVIRYSVNMFLISTIESLPEVSRQLLDAFPDSRVFALYGKMGAGKTTLIRELCRTLGVTGEVQSPTFSIINEYKTLSDDSVFHFDLYRINKIEELFDIGYEEYMYSGSYCFCLLYTSPSPRDS